MSFTILDTKKFCSRIHPILKLVRKKATLPIYTECRFTISDKSSYVHSTNSEDVWVSADITDVIKVHHACEFSITPNWIKILKGAKGTVEVEVDKNKLTLTRMPHVVSFPMGVDIEDWPVGNDVCQADEYFKCTIPNLSDGLKSISYAMGTDTARAHLQSVYFDFERGNLVATNGFQIDVIPGVLPLKKELPNLIVPRQAVKILETLKGPIELFIKKQVPKKVPRVYCRAGQVRVGFYSLSGGYPEYLRVFPDFNLPVMFKVDRVELLNLVTDAYKAVRNEFTPAVNLYARNNNLIVYARSRNQGEFRVTMPCTEGLPPGAGFAMDCKYLTSALRATESEEITFTFEPGINPIQVDLGCPSNRRTLIMPIKDQKCKQPYVYRCAEQDSISGREFVPDK